MKHYVATIKELGTDGKVHVLHPEFVGDVSKEYLIDFWGLNNDDVLEYEIKEVSLD